MIKILMHLCQHMDMGPLIFTLKLYQLLCFPTQIHLKVCLVDYAVTDMGCFDDYLDAAPHAKTIRRGGITTFLLHISQCITFNQKILLQKHLFTRQVWSHYIQG